MGVENLFNEEETAAKAETAHNHLQAVRAARTTSEQLDLLLAYIELLEDRVQELESNALSSYYDD